jgi:hypothetical protein
MLLHAPFLGCTKSENINGTAGPKTASQPATSLTLRVLVVNEEELAEAINRLRGEWAERGAGELKASHAEWADLATAEKLDADVVIFPSRYLGELCTRGWLRPLRTNVLQSEDFNADDLFPLVRRELMRWGGQVMAAPLGSQLVTAGDKYQGRPALRLLARAAPRVVTRERLGVLFEPETMKPRIAEPGFVEALQELVELGKPQASANEAEAQPHSDPATSTQRSQRPEATTDAEIVPVIGYGDRLASVTASSRNAASAFQLLEWLARADISSLISGAGLPALPVRRSLATSAKWYPANLSQEDREEQASTLQRAFNSELCLTIPRLPGIDQYMDALDSEVTAALDGKLSPREALENAARAWERFTEEHGREKQREAYLKHLGIAD